MDDFAFVVRPATPDDAAQIARVYISSWHDTYAGLLPAQLLCAMTEKGQAARWRATILAHGRERVLIAEHAEAGIVGMTSYGPARDGAGSYDGEVYTLYVDPCFTERGVGRALISAAFADLRRRGYGAAIVWAHAGNPARFFYEAMGGRMIARRMARVMGNAVPETGFGWDRLGLEERASFQG